MAHKNILVIQFTRQSMLVTEYKKDKSGISSISGQISLLPEEAGDRAVAGRKLQALLVEKKITCKNAIIIPQPADVLVRNMTIPPLTDMSMLKGIVHSRLQRELKLSATDITLDYSGTISSQKQNDILLAGLLKKRVHDYECILNAAGLVLEAVVPDFASLFQNNINSSTTGNIIHVENSSAKIITVEGGSIKDLATINVPGDNTEVLAERIAGEIECNPVENHVGTRNFTVISHDINLTNSLSSQNVTNCSFTAADTALGSVAADIADLYMAGKGFELNFTNNHFTEKKHNRINGNLRKVIIGGVGLLVLIGWFFLDWNQDKRDIALAQQWIDGMQENVSSSQKIIEKMNKAKLWCSTSPHYSECLREITSAFPDSASIWTNSLAMDENFVGVMTGSSAGKQYIQNALEGLISNPHFSEVKTLYIRQAGKSTAELSFALQFKYNFTITND